MIEITNSSFDLLGIISNYESLIFNRSWHGVGKFELHINKNKKNVDKLQKDNFIIVNKQENKVGIIEDIQLDCNNTKTLILSGRQLKGITNRRLTVTDNYDRVAKTNAENVFKHYINSHMIDTYYNNIATPERNIQWLKLAQTQNRGLETVWQSRYEYLDALMEHISKDTGLGWNIVLDLAQKCAFFDVYEGKDRSINQTVNPPVIFSDKKRNLSTSKITDNNSLWKNTGYTLGKGELEDRPLVIVKEAEYAGLNRREILLDMSNIEISDLSEEGKKRLVEYKQIKSIEGTIYQIPNMEYEKDWYLGDIVTVETEGYTEDKRITEIKEVYEKNKTNVEVTFGDKIPGLEEQIKKINNKGVL